MGKAVTRMEKKKTVLRVVRFTLLAAILLMALYLYKKGNFSVQALLDFAPKEPGKAAVGLLLLYAAKSATVFFPLVILEIAAGHLFSPWLALGINFAGIVIILTVPYWIGCAAGLDVIQTLVAKYPRFGEIVEKQQRNTFFLCYFLRAISCLPGDIVTMYLGATRTPYWQNLIGGMLGILPRMVLATRMGTSIQDPHSPAFWLSAILMVALALLSVLWHSLYRRRLKKKTPEQ